jgi:hypothetical protein
VTFLHDSPGRVADARRGSVRATSQAPVRRAHDRVHPRRRAHSRAHRARPRGPARADRRTPPALPSHPPPCNSPATVGSRLAGPERLRALPRGVLG